MVLLKHVLVALPVYLLIAASPPKSVLKELERRFSNFSGVKLRGIRSFIGLGGETYAFQVMREGWDSGTWRIFTMLSPSRNGTLVSRLDSVSDHLVADFVNNGTWDVQLIRQWVPPGIAREIAQVDPPMGQLPDLMVWRPSQRLPVDCCMWKFGFQGPSKYGCCQPSAVEMVDHVFAGIDVASRVWHFFGDTVGVSSRGLSFRVCMAAWWYGKRGNRYPEFVHHVLSLQICWHLWKGRNARKYDGTHIQEDRLCRLVFTDLLELFALFFPSCRAPRSSFKPVRWVRPLPGDFKLNTDGCSKGNPGISGSGGILRDGGGRFCLAFSCHFGKPTSLQAEARAFLVGVEMCVQGGFDLFKVELDSLVLVNILLGKVGCPWSIYKEGQQLLDLKERFPQVSHCFHQANQVADVLSNVGCSHEGKVVYTSTSSLPSIARGPMCLDRLGVPSIKRFLQD
nr:uncharacterized protein LOC113723448 [Coffea arabica]